MQVLLNIEALYIIIQILYNKHMHVFVCILLQVIDVLLYTNRCSEVWHFPSFIKVAYLMR